MNTLTRSAITAALTLISAFTWAQGENGSETPVATEVTVQTKVQASGETDTFNGPQFVQSLKMDELKTTERGEVLPSRANRVLQKLSHGIPPSREGIPGKEEEPDVSDLIEAGYPTNILLRRTMEDAERKSLGRKIHFYETQAARILQGSGEKANEEATRIVLNRSVDIVQNIIRWAGRNNELVAQFVAQFYAQNYEIALAYNNNPPPSYADSAFPRAKVGIYYSRMLFMNQGGLISNSAKAIILVKLLGYLGQDLNSDLRRRNEEYRYALLDIVNLQQNDDQYANILEALSKRKEPHPSDINGLRAQVNKILRSLPNQ